MSQEWQTLSPLDRVFQRRRVPPFWLQNAFSNAVDNIYQGLCDRFDGKIFAVCVFRWFDNMSLDEYEALREGRRKISSRGCLMNKAAYLIASRIQSPLTSIFNTTHMELKQRYLRIFGEMCMPWYLRLYVRLLSGKLLHITICPQAVE